MMWSDLCPEQIPLTAEGSVKTALETLGPSFFGLGPPGPPAVPEPISSAYALLINGTQKRDGGNFLV